MATRRTPVPAKPLGRPTGADSTETRARLLRAARTVFAERGYAATTNKELAERSGITPGAIYHYVPSKAELFVEVYSEVQHAVFDELDKAVAGATGYVARIHAILDMAVDLTLKDPALVGFLTSATTDLTRHRELAIALRDVRMRPVELIRRIVEEAQLIGEVDSRVDARAVEDILLAVLNGLAMFTAAGGDVARHAAAIDVLKAAIASTMRPR